MVVMLALACTDVGSDSDPGVDYPVYRYSHVGGVGPDGRYLYTAGGSGLGGRGPRHNAWRYDLDNGGWEQMSTPPAQIFRASWAMAGDTAYVHAGSVDPANTDTDQLLAWDVRADSWSVIDQGNPAPSPRFKEAATWTGEQLVVYGGRYDDGDATETYGELWGFDPVSGSWSELGQSGGPGPLTRVGLAWDAGREVLWLSGGIDPNGDRHAWLWSHDFKTGLWTQVVDDTGPAGKRASHTLVVVDGLVYIWGGQNVDPVWSFDPDGAGWQELEGPGPPGRDAQVTGVRGSSFVIFGGDPYDKDIPNFTNDIWSFDTTSQTWTEIEPWNP
jgi:hypothetical protein